MEYVGQRSIKKLCNFYVSDLHLSVMLLPYLIKQIDEDVEITTIFEDLKMQDFIEIIEKINIKDKNKILDINWTIQDKNRNNVIEKTIINGLNTKEKNTIIIGGSKKFILENNNKISEILNKKQIDNSIKIINCFNIEEVGIEMNNIVKQYDGVLNTSGENINCVKK